MSKLIFYTRSQFLSSHGDTERGKRKRNIQTHRKIDIQVGRHSSREMGVKTDIFTDINTKMDR